MKFSQKKAGDRSACVKSLDNYLILYMVIEQDVEIFRVISGYRDILTLFADESE